MDLILLEKIGKLGSLGDVVKVRAGYGRNYLVPQGKALPATRKNRDHFESQRAEFEAKQSDVLAVAETLAGRIAEIEVLLDRPAGTSDKLFGSVTNADISGFFKEQGVEIPRGAIDVPYPIRTLGEHLVRIRLHPDVIPEVAVRIERRVQR